MTSTDQMPIYIARYQYRGSVPHHSLVQEIERDRPEAVDAVYAARHADLPPVAVAYILHDESDDDYGVRAYAHDGTIVADEWWMNREAATRCATRAVERAVAEIESVE